MRGDERKRRLPSLGLLAKSSPQGFANRNPFPNVELSPTAGDSVLNLRCSGPVPAEPLRIEPLAAQFDALTAPHEKVAAVRGHGNLA